MLKRYLLGCLSAFVLAVALPAAATTVLPQSLDALTRTAAVAFEGTVTANRTERDAATNMIVTFTTFAVSDVLKGDVGTTHTIKQVGGELAQEQLGFRIQGIPTFVVGQQYVVFLAGVSRSGFSSPIGLTQGRFVVHDSAEGRKVTNGRDFRELALDIPASELPPVLAQQVKRAGGEPMQNLDLSQFKQLVRSRVAAVTAPGAVNK